MSMPIVCIRVVGFVSLAVALLIAGSGCAPSRNDANVVSQAQQFNQSIAPAEMKDPTLDSYLQQLGGRIVSAAKEADRMKIGPKTHFQGETAWMFQDIHFYLISSHTLNAFTTGGHSVYIYNELFQLCQNEEQLAAVMSHEFAHIYCRHVQKGMNNQMAMAAVALAAAGGGYVVGGKENGAQYAQLAGGGAAALGGTLMTGFTRDDEAQADQYGDVFYTIAGWDPDHFGDFFKVMGDKLGPKAAATEGDHPSLDGRVAKAKERAPNLEKRRPANPPGPVASLGQFKQYQQRAVQVAAQTPDDKKVLGAKELLNALPRSCWIPSTPPDQIEAQKELVRKAQMLQQQQQQQQQSQR